MSDLQNALTGDSILPPDMDDLPLTNIEQDKSQQQKDIEQEAKQAEESLVALRHHPGFVIVREILENRIAANKKLENVDFKALNNAELGEATRLSYSLAAELEAILALVDSAAVTETEEES